MRVDNEVARKRDGRRESARSRSVFMSLGFRNARRMGTYDSTGEKPSVASRSHRPLTSFLTGYAVRILST